MTDALSPLQHKRQYAIKVLAMSQLADIQPLWQSLDLDVDYQTVKPAQTGMVMVRAQTGIDGIAYNHGEMTVSRCVVQDPQTQRVGVGYTQGRSLKKVELIAVVDLCIQDATICQQIMDTVITPLAEQITSVHQHEHEQTQATQVDFFTMIRGE